jgi:hypothetical protein
MRGKLHSLRGLIAAYLNFELKDAPEARGLWPSKILDFEFQLGFFAAARRMRPWPKRPWP